MMPRPRGGKLDAYYVAEIGCRRDETGELTIQLRQQAASAAARSKKLSSVHAEPESHKEKTDSLKLALKARRK